MGVVTLRPFPAQIALAHVGEHGLHVPPHGRPEAPAAVLADVREGYLSEERARLDYPHAFTPER